MRTLLSVFMIFISLNMFGQFTAKLTNSVRGTSRVFNVHSDLNNYRYDFVESGMEGIVIAFPEENKMWLLLPEEKYIYKTTSDDFAMAANDPVAGIKMYTAYGEVKKTGTEKVAGYDCEVSEYYQGETKIFTAWHATELNFIIKATNHMAEDSFMELTEIKKWKVDPSMFKEPEGFTEVDERMRPVVPEPEPPSEWTIVKRDIPVNEAFSRGTKLQFVVNYDKYTKVKLNNNTESPSKIIFYQSADGNPLSEDLIGPVDYRTHRLFPDEHKTLTWNLKNGQELTIEIHEGEMHIEAAPE